MDYGATTAHRFLADVKLTADDRKLYFGTADDATISYTGTDLNINPKSVGTGKVNIQGNLTVDENALIKTDLNVNKNLYLDGNFFGNQIYGGDWNKQEGGFETVDLVTQDVYVRVRKLGAGALNGFTATDGNLIAHYSGMYQVTTTASVEAATGQGEYGMKGFVNETGYNNCYAHMQLDRVPAIITANPSFTCFVRMNAGDKFNTRFDNHEADVRDIVISSMNTTIVRVGN
jgi:hypothetical protein